MKRMKLNLKLYNLIKINLLFIFIFFIININLINTIIKIFNYETMTQYI